MSTLCYLLKLSAINSSTYLSLFCAFAGKYTNKYVILAAISAGILHSLGMDKNQENVNKCMLVLFIIGTSSAFGYMHTKAMYPNFS